MYPRYKYCFIDALCVLLITQSKICGAQNPDVCIGVAMVSEDNLVLEIGGTESVTLAARTNINWCLVD